MYDINVVLVLVTFDSEVVDQHTLLVSLDFVHFSDFIFVGDDDNDDEHSAII